MQDGDAEKQGREVREEIGRLREKMKREEEKWRRERERRIVEKVGGLEATRNRQGRKKSQRARGKN